MSSGMDFQKADFDGIYDQSDPRMYFATLQPFDYLIPQYGAEIFTRLLEVRGTAAKQPPRDSRCVLFLRRRIYPDED